MAHDIEKQPKWVQKKIAALESDIERLSKQLEVLENAHFLLQNYTWFTLGVHTKDATKLFILSKDHAQPVAYIGDGHVILAGRKKEKREWIPDTSNKSLIAYESK